MEFAERDSVQSMLSAIAKRWNNHMALAQETELFLRGSIVG